MDRGLLDFNPASHLVWWVAGAILVLLAFFLLLDGIDALRERRAARRRAREAEAAAADRPGSFRLRESKHPLRARYLRRLATGFRPWRSRGLGEPPWRDAEEWSPLERRAGKPPGDS